MANGTVATGTPVTVKLPAKAKGVSVTALASGGTIDVDWLLDEDEVNGVTIPWSASQLADGARDGRVFEGALWGFKVTGDGKFSYRVLY